VIASIVTEQLEYYQTNSTSQLVESRTKLTVCL